MDFKLINFNLGFYHHSFFDSSKPCIFHWRNKKYLNILKLICLMIFQHCSLQMSWNWLHPMLTLLLYWLARSMWDLLNSLQFQRLWLSNLWERSPWWVRLLWRWSSIWRLRMRWWLYVCSSYMGLYWGDSDGKVCLCAKVWRQFHCWNRDLRWPKPNFWRRLLLNWSGRIRIHLFRNSFKLYFFLWERKTSSKRIMWWRQFNP